MECVCLQLTVSLMEISWCGLCELNQTIYYQKFWIKKEVWIVSSTKTHKTKLTQSRIITTASVFVLGQSHALGFAKLLRPKGRKKKGDIWMHEENWSNTIWKQQMSHHRMRSQCHLYLQHSCVNCLVGGGKRKEGENPPSGWFFVHTVVKIKQYLDSVLINARLS